MSPSNDWHTNTIQYQTFTAPIIQQPPSSQSIDNKSKQNETKEKEESSAQQDSRKSFSFNKDDYRLKKKQERIDNLLGKNTKNAQENDTIENSAVIGMSASDFQIRRFSRRNKNLIAKISQYKKIEDNTTNKSLDNLYSLNLEPEREQKPPTERKTSLPVKLEMVKPQNVAKWLKDKRWLKKPEEGIIEIEKVNKLKVWLHNLTLSDDIEDLKIQFDWENNKPTKKDAGGLMTDPYNPIRGEQYFIQKPKELPSLYQYCGEAMVKLINGDQFQGSFEEGHREGFGKLEFGVANRRKLELEYIEGIYKNDILEGAGKIVYASGDKLICEFVNGVPNGPGKLFDPKGQLKQVGFLSKGQWNGLVWKYLEGGAFLHGLVDFFGHLTGDNVSYLYPDLQHCIVGTFNNGVLSAGQFCYVSTIRFKNCFLPAISFTKFDVPSPIFSYDPGTRHIMGNDPMIPDPYEYNHIVIKPSRVHNCAGEGIFAKCDIPEGHWVSFYNGIKKTAKETEKDKDDWEKSAYMIMDMLGPNPETGDSGVIDIPPEYVKTKNYVASLAHKCNHSFDPNSTFLVCHNPRFGDVPAIKTLRNIEAGEEITVSYDYDLNQAPPWYQDLYAKRVLITYALSKGPLEEVSCV